MAPPGATSREVSRAKKNAGHRARGFLLFALGGRDHDAGRAIYLSPRGRHNFAEQGDRLVEIKR